MSLPVLIGFAGVLVAAVATGMLAGRCVRQPRIYLVLWTAATLALTIALAAQSMGFASGFGPATFRAIQLFALLLAPLGLAWGLVELAIANDAARFGMRLISSALIVVTSVILATDPLTTQPFSKAWPLTGPHFQPVAHYALDAVQAVAVLAVVASVAMTAAGARSGPPAAAVLPVGLAVLMTAGQRFPLPAGAAYPLLSMAAAALVWFGASRVREPSRRAAGRDARRDGRQEGVRDGTGGRYRPGDDHRPGTGPGGDHWPGDRPGGDHVPEGRYATYGHRDGRPDPGRPPGDVPAAGSPGRRSGPQPRAPEWQDRYRGSEPGGPAADERLSGTQAVQALGPEAVAAGFGPSASAAGSPAAAPPRPYGRILIFTLLDDRVADFDRLAEEAAEHVRTGEPDTLVYVIHLVPNAPMQRIFYEIYRDRAAFDSHESQPSMQRFVAERRSCVLATNVIELRLKYAKVAPLPNPQAPAAAAPPPLPLPLPLPLPPPPGARGPQGPAGPQRLQQLPPDRPRRSDQQRYDQGRPDQRQMPSAGRGYGG
jgi:quinol monooxygenase YgiN